MDGTQTEEDINFVSNLFRHTILGVELFPNKGFNILLGYSFRRAQELKILEQRNFSGFSFGLGLKFNNIRFSYTHARYSSAANTSFLGLQINLQQ